MDFDQQNTPQTPMEVLLANKRLDAVVELGLSSAEQLASVEAILEETYELLCTNRGEEDSWTLDYAARLADSYTESRKYAQATVLLRKVVAAGESDLAKTPDYVAKRIVLQVNLAHLAMVLKHQLLHEEARNVFARCQEMFDFESDLSYDDL